MNDMIQQFSFATAGEILFGDGTAAQLPERIARFGNRMFLVTGSKSDRAEALLKGSEGAPVIFSIPGEPTVDLIREGAALAREKKCDVVVAVGGESVIDGGKAISALLTNHGDLFDYLEVIGKGSLLENATAPFIAVPTTAGTGAEVTKNAVLASREHRVKVSMRSPYMIPDLAIVDPVLTHSVPPDITASTGLDALTQVIEPFVSKKRNPLTDALCREGIKRAARSLKRVFDDGADAGARSDMALASLFGGLALANAGLGAVHGFAGPIGGMFPAPHGVICGRLLPHVFKANIEAAAENNELYSRFKEVSQLITGNPDAECEDGIQWLETLCGHLGIKSLSAYGVGVEHLEEITAAAMRASSMKGNPVELSEKKLQNIIRYAL